MLTTSESIHMRIKTLTFSAQNNAPVKRPQTPGGLTLVRFSGTAFYGSEEGDDIVGGIAGSIIDSRFKNNVFSFEGDEAVRFSRFADSCVTTLCNLTRLITGIALHDRFSLHGRV
jgi:hypothetical protein